jgi:transcription elongation factor Elf1
MEETNENIRFKDEGATIWSYLNRIFVYCPNCSKRALVSKEGNGYFGQVKINCPNCHYSQEGRRKTYDMELKFFCPDCAERVEKVIDDVAVKKDKIKVKCPNCGLTQAYKPRYVEKEWVFNTRGEATDPFYKLPLWLSGQIKNNTFWAYNYDHLKYLKGYIEAKLRTRSGRSYTSMVEKLPNWIKSKKNRDELITLIEKLEKK